MDQDLQRQFDDIRSRLDELQRQMDELTDCVEENKRILKGWPNGGVDGLVKRQQKLEEICDKLMAERQRIIWIGIGIAITAAGAWRDVLLDLAKSVIGP